MHSFSSVYMPKATFYGRDSFQKVGEASCDQGTKALIISDKIMNDLGYVDRCKDLLNQSGVTYATYLDVETEPTDVYVREALYVYRQAECDLIIALGGGSCIDAAKAVAVLAKNGGEISDYSGNKRIAKNGSVPLIAIPTTAGTGSEATDVTVITDTKNDVKMMIKQPALLPDVSIVDPLLTISSPKHVTAATGVDALTHAIEAYISRRSHPFTDTLALSAIQLIFESIQQAYDNGSDIEAREKMSLGAWKAGIAFSNASVCLVHGMSRPIGALFHVPHGVSNAMLLPAVLEFSQEECVDKLAQIGLFIKPELKGLPNNEIARTFVKEVKKLCVQLKIPNMKQWGINKKELDQVVHKMAKDALASGSPANNPKVPIEDEIVALYQVCFDYNMKEEVKL
ncbi:iron-containing alcohol dehydrogenase [Bacillus sp. EB106-08-02-XG196]|uniref:iron-containing alcohol dehydrogenase n=1 Tax=Bacillus sp. EB106-08-02-XG196 TaxID=2737049 RepID=UPI0015C44C24|nr:iron-containing alcohol dehydrogenase [Bacillus sp. EB106-08-02-XG196]NWQ43426.1 iron-containing alcohol dehydrogenase [Bacillus sp. EB106-08-02-XG196]